VTRNEESRAVFSADNFAGEKLFWKAPHFFEIEYMKAHNHRFTNIPYPFAVFGTEESWRYAVEIRLDQASTDIPT
jgi:hypothetical protein